MAAHNANPHTAAALLAPGARANYRRSCEHDSKGLRARRFRIFVGIVVSFLQLDVSVGRLDELSNQVMHRSGLEP